jgi:hypothetical protein
MPGDHRDLLDELTARVSEGVHDLQVYLATPEGRELRRRVAQFAIIAAPLLFRFRFFRATPVGRVLGVIGGAALVVKLAEALRDWEPTVELERAWTPSAGG